MASDRELMASPDTTVAERVEQVVADFADLEPRERLELLLEYAENLPLLPERYEAERLAGLHRVVECQTPVFIWTDLVDGRVQVYGWVAPEAPTVKGFVSILVEIFSGTLPEETRDLNLVHRLGLAETLGMVRLRGLSAVLFYMQKSVGALAGNSSPNSPSAN